MKMWFAVTDVKPTQKTFHTHQLLFLLNFTASFSSLFLSVTFSIVCNETCLLQQEAVKPTVSTSTCPVPSRRKS